MKVGDLVRWENAGGEYELGLITDTYADGNDDPEEVESINVMVYFLQDAKEYSIRWSDLEVINESR